MISEAIEDIETQLLEEKKTDKIDILLKRVKKIKKMFE